MKKYQLWLERKSYSQHLFNLMRIKSSNHSPDHLDRPDRHQRILNKSHGNAPARYREMEQYQQTAERLGDISYAITFKELKNRKLRLMRTFQILNQNMSMARRIKGVRSAVSPEQHRPIPDLAKRKQQEKKFQLTNDDLRQQNFRKFVKIQQAKENLSGGQQKYRLTMVIVQAPRVLRACGEFAACWVELETGKKTVRSQMVERGRLEGTCLVFALENSLEETVSFKLYASKGIDSSSVGIFQMKRPELGVSTQTQECTSSDQLVVMTVRVGYNWVRREKPSFTLK